MHELAPHVSCVVSPSEFQQALDAGYKQIYIVTSKGTLKHHVLRGENRFVRLKVDTIPGYEEPIIQEGVQFLPAGKIPYDIFEQIISFFNKVREVKKAELEAMAHVLYSAERGYHIGIPTQTISKASVSYDWSYIPEGSSIVLDIHSHNSMGAFFSGTDNGDDRNNVSFSGVVGKLDQPTYETKFRFNYYDKKYDAQITDIFDVPPKAAVVIPDNWIEQIKTGYQGYQGYQGGHSNKGNVQAGGRNHDHLKEFQFKKAGRANLSVVVNENSSESKTTSPNSLEEGEPQFNFMDHSPEELDSIMNGFRPAIGPNDELFVYDAKEGRYKERELLTQEEELDAQAEAALGFLNEGLESGDMGESHLGKSMGLQDRPHNPNLSQTNSDQNSSSLEDLPGFTDYRYEEIEALHGPDVADAWHSIDCEMVMLEGKDDINIGLMMDMFNLVSKEGQIDFFRRLYQELPNKEREKIQMFGLS